MRSPYSPPRSPLAATALPAKAATFVYVGCTDSNEIHVLQLDPQNGQLTQGTVTGIGQAAGSTPMAISRQEIHFFRRHARQTPMVAASFRIDPATGKLSHIANGPLDGSMAYIATDRSGRFLLAASYPPGHGEPDRAGRHGAGRSRPSEHTACLQLTRRFVLATSLAVSCGSSASTPRPAALATIRRRLPVRARAAALRSRRSNGGPGDELEASVYVFTPPNGVKESR